MIFPPPLLYFRGGTKSDTLRYWLFQNNQVNGPYDPDELSQLPSFSAESLVCPEGRKGTSMGDWQRAGLLPELSLTLIKSSQLSVAGKGRAGGSPFGSLPPEPTLRDLAALGSIQEKVSMLEHTVTLLQSELRLKDTEISGMHVDLESKTAVSRELKSQLEALEAKIASVQAGLNENLEKAVAAEKGVESTVETQGKSLHELSGSIESLKIGVQEIDKLKEELRGFEKLRDEVRDLGKLKEEVHSLEKLKDEVKELEKRGPSPLSKPAAEPPKSPGLPGGPGMGGLGMGAPPPPVAKPPEIGGLPPITASLENVLPAMSATPVLPPPPSPALSPSAPPPPSPASAPGATTQSPAQPPKGKGKLILAVVAAAALLVGGAYVFLGKPAKAPEEKVPPVPMDQTPLPPPPPPEPAGPTPEQLEEQVKAGAIDFLRQWPAGAGGTVSSALEGPMPQQGGLSPWMAEKIRDGLYQVNFYPSKSEKNPNPRPIEFEVDLGAKTLKGKNAAAVELLALPKPAAPKKKVAVKPKTVEAEGAELFGELTGGEEPPAVEPAPQAESPKAGEPPAPAPKQRKSRAKAKAPEKEPSLDDLLLPGVPKLEPADSEPAAPARAPKAAAKKTPAEAPAEDAEILDDLLNP